MSRTSGALLVEKDGPVRIVTMNRPDQRNAVNEELHLALAQVWSEIASDADARVVVLTGAGKAFSAGGDMELILKTAEDEEYRYDSMYHARRIVTEMMAFPLPVIAAVNGPAVGLGCSVAFLSDLVFASERAFFADPHVSIGLVAADGGALCWPLLTSLIHAKEFLYTGDKITAEHAEQLGMANRVVAPDDLMPQALEMARRLADQPQRALRDTKRAINIHLSRAVNPVLDFAFSAESETFSSEAFREGIRARVSQ
ncbi:enoyl-CoA hydratase/isomerase family protein [Aeromicrobium panaciterrae]|uniref:enoyl-CoA hydratase/isomerase family protein n=1 Tax=Aeromicrobium panaciterrae TaxID=363861 RepID=UPI0031D1A236